MRAILVEMEAGSFKINNSSPLSDLVQVCTKWGILDYNRLVHYGTYLEHSRPWNYFVESLNAVRPY